MRIRFPTASDRIENEGEAEERRERKERNKIVEDYWGESESDW